MTNLTFRALLDGKEMKDGGKINPIIVFDSGK